MKKEILKSVAANPSQPLMGNVAISKADALALAVKKKKVSPDDVQDLLTEDAPRDSLESAADADVLLAQANTGNTVSDAGVGSTSTSPSIGAPAEAATSASAASAAGVTSTGMSGLGLGLALVGGAVLSAANTGQASSGSPAPSNVVSGSVVAGPVVATHQLYVQLYQKDGTTKVGSETKLNADGSFSVNVGSFTGGVIAKIIDKGDGNDYMDEALIAGKDLNATLTAVAVVSSGSNTLNITPITTLAARKAGLAADGSGAIASDAAISSANTAVAKAFGLTESIVTTTPVAVVTTTGANNSAWSSSTAAGKYGALLASLSGIDRANGNNTETTLNVLFNGTTVTGSDGTLSATVQGALLGAGDGVGGVTTSVLAAILAPTSGAAATALGNTLDSTAAAALTPTIAANLTAVQLQSITDPSVISPAAIAALSPAALASLTITQLGSLSVAQQQNLSAAQVVALAGAGKLAALSDISAVGNAVTSLDAAALGALDSSQLGGLSTSQITAIANAGKLGAITDLASLGTDISALSATQIAALTNTQLGALNAAQIAALATAGKLANLGVDLLANPVVNQIGALGDDIAGINAAALATLSNAQLDGLTARQIGLLASATPSALTALTATQIAALGTDISGLTAVQVKALSPLQLAAITSAQADALALTNNLSALTATEIILLNGAAIDAVPTNSITQLSAAQVNALSDTQLLGLTKDQVSALATAGKLSALTDAKIAALGNDINGLTAAQVNALGNAQLLGLTKSQIGALATDGDLSLLTGAKLLAVGADISGINAAQAAALTDTQLADLDAAQIGALAADGDLAQLTGAQIVALGADITGLTAAQVSTLSAPQLGGLTDAQAAALAAAGDLASLTAANIGALSADAIDRVPTSVITTLGAQGVAALTLAQVQALTGEQLAALNTAGLLDDLTQPLSSAQVTSAAPAGLGFNGIDTADKLALFNDAVQTASGTAVVDLAAIATGVAAVQAAVSGGALTVANLQALGLTGASAGNLAAITRLIDATSAGTDGSLVNSINELKAMVANASGELADGYINSADAADGVSIAVALPAGASVSVGDIVALTLPGAMGLPDQTINHTLTQANLDAGYALVAVSQAQLTAAGQGDKAFTASVNSGAAFAVATVALDTVAPSTTTFNPNDGSTVLTNADLSLVFDAPVTKGTGNIRLVNDTDSTTTTIAISSNEISISGNTLTINPTADMLTSKAYHIELDAGAIVDLAGNPHAGIGNATAWNFTATTLASSLDSIAGNNKVSQAEGASPIAITGTVSALGSAAAAIAALQAGDITLSLVPQGGGTTVNLTATSYNTGTGTWAASVGANTLVDGKTYDVVVNITGSAGAAAGLQAIAKASVVVDLTPPTAPTITSVTDDVGTAAVGAGTVLPGGDTNDTSPLVRVSITGTGALAGDTVQLYNGTASNASTLGAAVTLTSTHLTQGFVNIALSGLNDATTYTLAARVTDGSGNLGAVSVGHSINVDTTAPTLTVSAVALSADTKGSGVANAHGSTSDLNTATANQTITATLSGSGLANGDKLWGSLNGGTSWADITAMVSGTAITWTGATLAGSNNIVFKVADRAGNEGANTGSTAYVLDSTAPSFSSAATTSFVENGTGIAYNAQTTEADTGMYYTLSGADAARFSINNATGEVSFISAPNYEAASDVGANNVYDFTVRATDLAGNFTDRSVALTVTDYNPTSSQLFALWQSDGAGGSGTATTTGALQALSAEISSQRAITSADGTANGTNALSQYIDRVTGTDVVSDAEFDAGFSITGHTTAGQSGTIKFYLDNNRTDGVEEIGTQLVSGSNGVTISYNNTNGDYTISFAANSSALLQATHNTYSSGVHKLTVDTNGSGAVDAGEASRLFLVADGTASNTDIGLVSQNYSVQDRATGNVFVYYYGDPDANGIGLWTLLDNTDTQANVGLNTANRDNDANGYGDSDYYNTTGVTLGTQTTTANTALGFVTNITAQVWEFQMAKSSASPMNWNSADILAGNHSIMGSNTSRLGSLNELLALYAANFGGNSAGGGAAGNTVGVVQSITDTTSFNGNIASEDNRPGGWGLNLWTSAPTPSGHANVLFIYGDSSDRPDSFGNYVSAVL